MREQPTYNEAAPKSFWFSGTDQMWAKQKLPELIKNINGLENKNILTDNQRKLLAIKHIEEHLISATGPTFTQADPLHMQQQKTGGVLIKITNGGHK